MQFKLTPTMQHIVSEVERLGKAVWVVGGAVRDTCMNKIPKDIDFATNYDHLALEVLLRKMGLVVIPDATARQHGIIRVIDRDTGEVIDIARLRKDCKTDGRHAIVEFTDILEEDLARRDFTINAMACQINSNGDIINEVDRFSGLDDLRMHVVHFVGNMHDRIREDYLRMVRLCRFTALGEGWRIGPPVTQVKKHAEHIKQISKERIRDEIIKAVSYPKPSNFFRNMHACGLLNFVMPDLSACVGVGQNEYHAEPVFDHLMRALDASVDLTENPMLRLAALLHDIGKPPTRSVDEDSRVHFYNHEVAGTSLVYKWMKEYKFTREQIEYVCKMVRHHQWRFTDDTKDKTIKKWLTTVGLDSWRDLITLRCADRKGNLAKAHKPMITKKMHELMQKVQAILDHKEPLSTKDLAINGHDLIEMGLKPGKVFKDILGECLEQVIEDPCRNEREWLLQYITEHYLTPSSS